MKTLLRHAFFAAIFALVLSTVRAVEYRTMAYAGKRHVVCAVDPKTERLELFLKDGKGAVLHRFAALETMLAARGQRLAFGMNAGMFHPNYAPVGLYVAEGREVVPLNNAAAEGNFFLKPNGVFAVLKDGTAVVAGAADWPAFAGRARLATQSGPMLVIDGKLHPVFREGSDSRLFRNGVGIAPDGKALFVISAEPVNFYEFATLFRDTLRCRNALFFDGTISSLYAPELKRNDDMKFPLGPILGVTAAKP